MNTINLAYLHYFTAPLHCGADIDEMYEEYLHFDPNDEVAVKAIVQHLFLPYFYKYPKPLQLNAKQALRLSLLSSQVNLESVFDAPLLPFDTPNDPRLFYF